MYKNALFTLFYLKTLSIFQQPDIDDCNPNPCMNGGMCSDGVNNYTCTCAPGYTDANCTTGIFFK